MKITDIKPCSKLQVKTIRFQEQLARNQNIALLPSLIT